MSKGVKEKVKKTIKKSAQKEVYSKLVTVFAEYRNGEDNKKFDRRLRKASKLVVPLVIKGKPDTKVEQ
ncbi:MAG: hypothetical protein ACRDE8_08160 [Ginsengibacter sp.]